MTRANSGRRKDPGELAKQLQDVFANLVAVALEGRRCPENGTSECPAGTVSALARAGKIRVEISDKNYRTVEILEGEHKGKRTLGPPSGAKPWRILDADGDRHNGKMVRSNQKPEKQPWKPGDPFPGGSKP